MTTKLGQDADTYTYMGMNALQLWELSLGDGAGL